MHRKAINTVTSSINQSICSASVQVDISFPDPSVAAIPFTVYVCTFATTRTTAITDSITMVFTRTSSLIALLSLQLAALPLGNAFSPAATAQHRLPRNKQQLQRHTRRSSSSSSTELQSLFGLNAPVSPPFVTDPLHNRHSASDWLYNIQSFPQSKVLREIRNPVLAVTGWSFVVSLVYRLCQSSSSSLFNTLALHMSIPGTAHSFLVSALGLLLVFRTNSAYQRFNVSGVCASLRRNCNGDRVGLTFLNIYTHFVFR